MEALTLVGYASLSIEGVSVCPNALIGRMIAGEEGFQTEDGVLSSVFCGVSMIFGCPVPKSFGGNDPIKYNCSIHCLENFVEFKLIAYFRNFKLIFAYKSTYFEKL